MNATVVFIILIINISFTAWASRTFPMTNGIGTLPMNDCTNIRKSGIAIHVTINLLGTMMLSGSNYTMQYLSAPTREEVDTAHRNGRWLDIGIPSTRNLKSIAWRRKLLWFFLALSSVPIHLMYNSAIFETLGVNTYNVLMVTKEFRANEGPLGSGWDHNLQSATYLDMLTQAPGLAVGTIDENNTLGLQNKAQGLVNLTAVECVKTYQNPLQSRYCSVLLITDKYSMSDSVLGYTQSSPVSNHSTDWIFAFFPMSQNCTEGRNHLECTKETIAGITNWFVLNHLVDYCMAEIVDGKCKLQFSTTIMIIVILCDAVCMVHATFNIKDDTLVTIGDAVSSFLGNPEQRTKGLCLFSKKDTTKRAAIVRERAAFVGHRAAFLSTRQRRNAIEESLGIPQSESLLQIGRTIEIQEYPSYQNSRYFWYSASSPFRWLTFIVIVAIVVKLSITVLASVMIGDFQGGTLLEWLTGGDFGSVSMDKTILKGQASGNDNTIIDYILLANCPQMIFSFLYLLYNGIYTIMCLESEWNQMGYRRRGLRVTSPVGKQRSTYFLQLPYRYAIPLMIISGVIHWIVSQSLFLARIEVYNLQGQLQPDDGIMACGYSPLAMFHATALSILMILALVLIGFRRFKPGIPLTSGRSFAISAACHGVLGDENAAFEEVQWGVIQHNLSGTGHYGFSSKDVLIPIEGEEYI